jgi:hypothetical protein
MVGREDDDLREKSVLTFGTGPEQPKVPCGTTGLWPLRMHH